MIVITILAAIVIIVLPSFIGQSDKAHDAAAKSDLVNVYREAVPLWAERKQIPADIVDQISDNAIPVEPGSHWSKNAVSVNRIQPDWITFRKESETSERFMIVAPLKGKPERYSIEAGLLGETRTNISINPFFADGLTTWRNWFRTARSLSNDVHLFPGYPVLKLEDAESAQPGDVVKGTIMGAEGSFPAGEKRTVWAVFRPPVAGTYRLRLGNSTSKILGHSPEKTVSGGEWEVFGPAVLENTLGGATNFVIMLQRRDGELYGLSTHLGAVVVETGDQRSRPALIYPTPGLLASGEATWTGAPNSSSSQIAAWQSW